MVRAQLVGVLAWATEILSLALDYVLKTKALLQMVTPVCCLGWGFPIAPEFALFANSILLQLLDLEEARVSARVLNH